MQLTADHISQTFELLSSTRSLIEAVQPREAFAWDCFFEQVITKKRSLVKLIPAPLAYPIDPAAEDEEALHHRRSHNAASKALSLSLESDFVQCYIATTHLIQDAVETVLDKLALHYDSNKRYDMLHLKLQVFEQVRLRHASWFRDLDPHRRLEQHVEALVMETIGFCEDFKTHWMRFFFSEQFFDFLDEGGFDFKQFSSIAFASAMQAAQHYPCLHGVLSAQAFMQTVLKLRRFFASLGRYILEYFFEIGRDAQNELQQLEKGLKKSKILTSQIVVACVARLRHSLQAQNRSNLKRIAYLMHVDARVVQAFWKAALLNFDKDLSSPAQKEVSDPDRKRISDIYLVERESDRRRGILVHVSGSLHRYVLHKNAQGRLLVVETGRVSHR